MTSYKYKKLPSIPCHPVDFLNSHNHLAYIRKLSFAELDHHTDLGTDTRHDS